jgi:O-antigen ligase
MRYLLALLIFFLATADVFGWAASLAPGLSAKNAILYLIILTLAARFVVSGGLRLQLPQIHLWLAVLIAYATLSWLVTGLLVRYQSYTLLSSGIDLKAFLLDNVLVFVLFLYGTQTFADAKFLLKCVLLAVAAANTIAIGNVAGLFHIGITTVGIEGNLAGRVFGAFGHANETAALIVCLLPAYVAATLCSDRIERCLWAVGGMVSTTVMFMSGSRGAFMGLTLGVAFGSYVCRRLLSWRRAAILVVLLLAVAVTVLAFVSVTFGDILVARVLEMFHDPDTSGDERVYIWRPIVERMTASPVALITGFGWDAYEAMGFFYASHNHYLSLWFELGLVGLASYLMVIRQLVITARRAAANAPVETVRYLIAFIYGIIAMSVAVFFSELFKPWLYIWTYSGLTMRMAVIAMQTAQEKAHDQQRSVPAIAPSPAATLRARRRLPTTQRRR